jgi:hypothetical protein
MQSAMSFDFPWRVDDRHPVGGSGKLVRNVPRNRAKGMPLDRSKII